MNQAAQDKLRELRQRLTDLEPYPWDPVETWVSKATPLIRQFYPKHLAAFKRVSRNPTLMPPFQEDNFEEMMALGQKCTAMAAPNAKQPILNFPDELLDLPLDDTMGSKFTTNITGSTVGAVAVGDYAVATGTVNVHQGPLTQAQHLEHIKAAKKALADDEERLDAAVHEALEKFLKGAREVKVEAREIFEVQAELEGILDRAWAEHQAKALPQGLKVTQALAQSPVMAGVTRKLGA